MPASPLHVPSPPQYEKKPLGRVEQLRAEEPKKRLEGKGFLGNLSIQTVRVKPRDGRRNCPKTQSSLKGQAGLDPQAAGRQVRPVPGTSG